MSLLDLLISPAAAQTAGQPQGSPISFFVMMAFVVGVFYFLAFRPQMKRQKEHRELMAKLAKGDEVICSGGLAGRIDDLGEHFVTVEIADGVRVKIQKGAVTAVLPKGTLKSA